MVWVDIVDGVLDAGDPPRAEIAVALRGNDRANAEKLLVHEFAGSGSSSVSETWGTRATDYAYIPLDVPSDGRLYIPYKCTLNLGASQFVSFNGQYRILLGAKISDTFEMIGGGVNRTEHHVFVIEVETSLRGTTQAISLQSQCADNDPTDPVGDKSVTGIGGPDELYRSQASIRVP